MTNRLFWSWTNRCSSRLENRSNRSNQETGRILGAVWGLRAFSSGEVVEPWPCISTTRARSKHLSRKAPLWVRGIHSGGASRAGPAPLFLARFWWLLINIWMGSGFWLCCLFYMSESRKSFSSSEHTNRAAAESDSQQSPSVLHEGSPVPALWSHPEAGPVWSRAAPAVQLTTDL